MHALIILSVMAVLEHVTGHLTGLRVILDLVAPGYYCLFALACASSLHRARALLLVLLAGVVLGCTPMVLPELTRLLVPVGIGIVAGTAARGVIQE